MTGTIRFDAMLTAPVWAPIAGALLVLLVDAIAPRARAVVRGVALLASIVGFAGTAGLAIDSATSPHPISSSLRCLVGPDGGCFLLGAGTMALALQAIAEAGGLIALLMLWQADRPLDEPTQRGGATLTVATVLFAVGGACAVAAAGDLGTWLVGLELATLPVIALVALRGTARASHGALSLLTTSVLSFGLLVVGAALWVVATGEPTLTSPAAVAAWGGTHRPVLILAALAMLAGVGFKLSLVPFHAWTPAAYGGASTGVVGVLAAVSKVAAAAGVIAVVRPLTQLAGTARLPHQLAFVIAVLAAVTMTVGTATALRQDDAVRLLAWSAIAQAGWVLLPLSALTTVGLTSAAGYVIAYAAATLAVVAVVAVVSGDPADGHRPLTAYRGLIRERPLLGGALLLGLTSLAGLPPGVLGLVAKVLALQPVLGAGLWPLALIAVVNAVVGVAVYLRWVALVLSDHDGADVSGFGVVPAHLRAAVVIATLVLVAGSVAPQLLAGLPGAG